MGGKKERKFILLNIFLDRRGEEDEEEDQQSAGGAQQAQCAQQ
jgi:hypothetical protein